MLSIKILGTGCSKCQKLFALAQRAVAAAGVQATLEKVEKLDEIMDYGVMMTPALVIDEQVKSSGRLPSPDRVVSWLMDAASLKG